MVAAAYASVLSLLRVIDNVQHPSHLRFFPDPTQFDALREKLCSLQDLLEVQSETITDDVEGMLRKIPRSTKDAEILIDNYVVDQLYRELEDLQHDVAGRNIDYICDEIHRVIQEIVTINEALKTMKATQEQPRELSMVDQLDRELYSQDEGCRSLESFRNKIHRFRQVIVGCWNKALKKLRTLIIGNNPLNNDHSLKSYLEKNKMVGFDDQLNQVLEKLIAGNQRDLVIVPIVGMGGIGKTTLARSLFDHPYNSHYFQVRIWFTISQDYSVRKVLQGLLQDGVLGDRELGDVSEAELITRLHQKLYGQRYLIVLDDVWSTEAWNDLRRGFPHNGKGSRVVVTTRLSEIASSLGSHDNSYSMKFLDEDKSWDLFSEKAFEKGGQSPELEKIGREISKRCKGLPLTLVLIGGLLANSNKTVKYWQAVKQNINSFANSAYDEYCLRILSLSYHHMPIHLKPCFLYMRHFEEDKKVKVSHLIKRWVSEGFVKPMLRGKSLEEAARKYLEDLVGRNMLLIQKRGRNGNIKMCGVHDLLRELSIKESKNEQALLLELAHSSHYHITKRKCARCLEKTKDKNTIYHELLGSKSDDKIRVCSSCESTFPELARSRFVCAVEFGYKKAALQTTCRWIAHSAFVISVFRTIRLIWNLEILDMRGLENLPKEFWEMPQLRHVKVRSFSLPERNDVIVLENLQTLTTRQPFKFTEEIVRRIPNIRKLGARYTKRDMKEEEDWSCFYLQNVAHLRNLESLSIECWRVSMDLNVIVFPCSLKKLTLKGCGIPWDDLTIIGSLPNLQVLKLLRDSVVGEEWNPIDEGEFLGLKYLELHSLDLVHWRVDHETQFPALETLVLIHMNYLEAIPQEIGELPSLKSIHLGCEEKNIIDSAKVIVEEQQTCGNEGLVLLVNSLQNRIDYCDSDSSSLSVSSSDD